MPENAPGFTQACVNIPPYTLVGGPENVKLLFDEELDSRRELQARARAWESITLLQQQNLVAFSHAVNMGSLLSAQAGVTQQQTGVTDNQQPVSPIRTGAADSQVQMPPGAAYPPNRQTDTGGAAATSAIIAGVAEAVQGNVTAQISDLTVQVNALAALIAQFIANSGSAGAKQASANPTPSAS